MQGYVLLGLLRDRLCFQCRVTAVTPIWPPLSSLALEEQTRKHVKSERGARMQSLYCLIDTSIQPRLFKGNALAWPCSVRGHCYIETDNSSLNHLPKVKSTAENVACVVRCLQMWLDANYMILERNWALFNSCRLYLWILPHQTDLNMSQILW